MNRCLLLNKNKTVVKRQKNKSKNRRYSDLHDSSTPVPETEKYGRIKSIDWRRNQAAQQKAPLTKKATLPVHDITFKTSSTTSQGKIN